MEQSYTSHIIRGFILAAVLISLDLLGSTAALSAATWFRFLPSIFLFLGSVISIIHFTRQTGNTQSFGDNFAFGFKTTAVTAVIMIAYTFIALKFIHPQLQQGAYDDMLSQIKIQGNTLEQDAEMQAHGYADKVFVPLSLARSMIVTLVLGAAGSALGAFIAKKNA